ncbi:MAG TPA: D-glycero-beta-D-manno-heptose-7-phosphate kinase [Nitrospira sp.]|nr:D-glycero-beta-D-manno-heptose-7-phosphate kinase [Nitrospira sp.]
MTHFDLDLSHGLHLIRAFQGRRVLILGDLMLDRYWWGRVERISPEAPVPVVRKQQATHAPGGAANVACNIAALGGQPLLLGLLGADAAADEFRSALSERGLDLEHLLVHNERVTTVKTRILAHNQHVVRVDEENTQPIDASLLQQVLDRVQSLLPSCDVVILSDYAKGLLTPALLQQVIAQAAQQGRRTVVDPKGSDYSRYNDASVLTPNRMEALLAAGLPPTSKDSRTAATKLLQTLSVEAVLVTEGDEGMTLFDRSDAPRHVPALARTVYDVTGAGDTVIATLSLALAAGASLWTAAQLANVAAGLAVEQIGTTAVSSQALAQALEDGRHLPPNR